MKPNFKEKVLANSGNVDDLFSDLDDLESTADSDKEKYITFSSLQEDSHTISKKIMGKLYYAFKPDHPQHMTKMVQLLDENECYLPNFISPIPQSDQGDRDYYCSVIMTLFKPWNCPSDLKDSETSWEDSFDQHQFDKIKTKLMQNFNIRYDIKDDYHEQRNKSTKDGETDFLQRMFGMFVEDSNVDNDDGDYIGDVNHDGSKELYDITGELSIKKATQASNMVSVL